MNVEGYRKKQMEESRQYAAKTFGVPLEEVAGYHGGICYSTCWLRTETAAKTVAKSASGEFANGGYFDGMPLGAISTQPWNDGTRVWRVTC